MVCAITVCCTRPSHQDHQSSVHNYPTCRRVLLSGGVFGTMHRWVNSPRPQQLRIIPDTQFGAICMVTNKDAICKKGPCTRAFFSIYLLLPCITFSIFFIHSNSKSGFLWMTTIRFWDTQFRLRFSVCEKWICMCVTPTPFILYELSQIERESATFVTYRASLAWTR